MSNQKRLSQLSLAAVALFAAALPCLAQTESSNHAMQKAQGTEIATLRNERLGVRKAEPGITSEKSVTPKATSAARDKFNEAIAEAMSSKSPWSSPATISESAWQETTKLSNQPESISSRRITFVPSRGQKLPD